MTKTNKQCTRHEIYAASDYLPTAQVLLIIMVLPKKKRPYFAYVKPLIRDPKITESLAMVRLVSSYDCWHRAIYRLALAKLKARFPIS